MSTENNTSTAGRTATVKKIWETPVVAVLNLNQARTGGVPGSADNFNRS